VNKKVAFKKIVKSVLDIKKQPTDDNQLAAFLN
jgi:hypothetical protein